MRTVSAVRPTPAVGPADWRRVRRARLMEGVEGGRLARTRRRLAGGTASTRRRRCLIGRARALAPRLRFRGRDTQPPRNSSERGESAALPASPFPPGGPFLSFAPLPVGRCYGRRWLLRPTARKSVRVHARLGFWEEAAAVRFCPLLALVLSSTLLGTKVRSRRRARGRVSRQKGVILYNTLVLPKADSAVCNGFEKE